jgi:hypothetical protein
METTTDLSQYIGQQVVVTQNLPEPDDEGNSAIEVEGKVQTANELGILIKPKGQVNFKLIRIEEIEDVVVKHDKAKALKATVLKPVTLGQARRHLLERHGLTLTEANGLSEEAALQYHNSLDHEQLDLGHVHEEKKDKGSDEDSE